MLTVPQHYDFAAVCCTAVHLALVSEMILEVECASSRVGVESLKAYVVSQPPPTSAVIMKV